MTHELWASLNQRMVEFLDSVTLQKLVDEQLAKGVQIEDKPIAPISTTPVVKPIRVNAPTPCSRWATLSPNPDSLCEARP